MFDLVVVAGTKDAVITQQILQLPLLEASSLPQTLPLQVLGFKPEVSEALVLHSLLARSRISLQRVLH
eukprot:666721-Rhodomonas_salina.1